MSLDQCLIKHVPRAYWDEVKKYAEAYRARGLSEDEANLRAAEDMVKMINAELTRVENEVVSAYEKSPLFEKETENAVQERGAEEVPVREGAGDRQAVGEGNAQGQEAATEGQAQKVIAWAKKKFRDAIAPNGNPVWQNFVNWFGGSKVVDENGEPVVVYHGMPNEMEGDVFRPSKYGTLGEGIYFTDDPGSASNFATGKRYPGAEGKQQGNVVPAYLKMEQPFDDNFFVGNKDWQEWAASVLRNGAEADYRYWVDDAATRWQVGSRAETASILKALHDKLMAGKATINDLLLVNGNIETAWGQKILEAIKAHGGFDGVILKNSGKGFNEYVVFKPEQVKSATGNNGNFDQGVPRILRSKRNGSKAPDWVPQQIWDLHEKLLAKEEAANVWNYGATKANETKATRRLLRAVAEYLPGDNKAQLALMVRMNEESSRRQKSEEGGSSILRSTKGEVGDFVEVVQGANTLGQALTLARADATPEAQALIDWLLTLPGAMSAKFSARRTGKNFPGEYLSKTHTVKLYEGASLFTLLHEAVHGATVNSLGKHIGTDPSGKFFGKTDTGRNLIKLYEAAQKAIKDRGLNVDLYGMKDLYEFVSEAFSNKQFQTLLASIPYESPKKNMLDKFTGLVKQMLGLSKEDSQISSLLDAVIAATEGLAQENEQLIGTTDVVANAPGMAAPKLNDLKVNTIGKFRRGLMQFMFLRDIEREKGGILTDEDGNSLVKKYTDKVFEMAAYANDLLKESSKIAKRWESLGKEATKLSELAADATYSQIHPDIPLDLESHETTVAGKMISNRHLADADGNFSDRVREQHAALRKQYLDLSNDGKMVYKQARDNMAKNWDEREKLLNDVARAVYGPQIDQAEKDGNTKLANKLRRDLRNYLIEVGAALSRLSGPYFPLERFGEYYVVYKSEEYQEAEADLKTASEEFAALMEEYAIPTGEERAVLERLEKAGGEGATKLTPEQKTALKAARKKVTEARKVVDELAANPVAYRNEAFESEAAAQAAAKELGVKVHLQQEQLQEVFGMSRALVNKVTDYVSAGMPETQANEVRRAMMEIFLKSKPDTSATRNELRRRNVAGFSRDMLRSYANYGKRDAHYLSRLKYTDETTAALYDMNRAARASDSLEAEELANELMRRHGASLNYVETPGQDLISSTAFVWQLALSPSFWLLNSTQPWMVSFPFMSGRHKTNRTRKALFQATIDTFGAMKTSMKEQGTVFFEVDTSKFAPDEKAMLDKALKNGLLDITLEMDVGAIAEGKATTSATGKITRAISLVPHQIEVANRVATALTAYRLEKQKLGAMPDAQDASVEYALRVLDKTHFDYSATNAPYWLKPGVFPFSKVLFQYRKYQIGILSLVATQWKQAMKGATKDERREARDALFGLAATHGALAGAVGLPFASTAFFIADVIMKVFGDDDEPWPGAEVVFRNYLADVFGVKVGAVLAKGLPMAIGVDLSGRLGMGDIATPIKLLRDNKEGRDLYLEILAGALGPAIGGLGAKAADVVQYVSQGDIVKGAEQFLPKMFADMLKAHRISTKGVTTRRNMVALPAERIDAMETFLTGLGIPVSQITERGEAVGAFEAVKKQLQDRRSELTKAYIEAREKGDSDRLVGIRNAVREYNAKRRANGEKLLTEAELLQAYQQRRRVQKDFTQQGVLVRKSERPLTQYSRFADVE